MARVVQQQKSNPPYLLILFVFLFLVATVVAVLMYLDSDKGKVENKRLADKNTALVGNLGDTPPVLAMLEKNKTEADHPSVVAQLQQLNGQLTQIVAGDAQSAKAPALAEQAYSVLSGSRPGLASAVVDAYGKIAAQREDLQKKQKEADDAKAELAKKNDEIKKLSADFDKDRTEANAKVTELDTKLKTLQDERTKAEADLAADRDKEIKSRDKTIAEDVGKITILEKKLKDKQKEIDDAKAAGAGPVVNPGDISSLKPTGKVLSVTGSGDAATVYLSLGVKDRVRAGMGFSVYPAGGIPNDANNSKAKIVVTSVSERSSQCRVTLLRDKNNQILPDDLVYNLFLDRARKFVVVGLFDIYGTNVPSAQGAEEVKLLIQRYGGTVENEVTTDTDFVVVGSEPAGSKTPTTGETAAPPSPEVEKVKAAYAKAVADAVGYKIPVLNTNRFLNLIGFDPATTTGGK
jgi:hypothetical protein